jgi:hypothetical protein
MLLLLLLFHHFTIFSYHYRPRWPLRVFREDGAGAAAVQVLHAKILCQSADSAPVMAIKKLF